MEALLIIPVIIVLAIILRLIAGGMDHDRVDRYISERSGKVIEKSWDPFGKGWFGDKDNRIYQIKYEDADGKIHQATCKTSLLSGVYLTEDRIVGTPGVHEHDSVTNDLLEENRRLRQEIEALKKNRKEC